MPRHRPWSGAHSAGVNGSIPGPTEIEACHRPGPGVL